MLNLLIVEDDRDVATNIAEFLTPRGYHLDFAYDGKTALALASALAFDVIVLDLQLPRLDGIGVGASLRAQDCDTPILVLTASDGLSDKAAAFEVGVDDYLVKPFALAELEMRVQALNRRYQAQGRRSVLEVADLRFDTGTLQVTRSGQPVKLNATQQTILALLMRASPNVISKQAIAASLWGDDPPGPDTLRTHIFELRQALDKPFGDHSTLIHTEHGRGYALRPPESDRSR